MANNYSRLKLAPLICFNLPHASPHLTFVLINSRNKAQEFSSISLFYHNTEAGIALEGSDCLCCHWLVDEPEKLLLVYGDEI